MRSIEARHFVNRIVRPVVFAAGVGGAAYFGGIAVDQAQRFEDFNNRDLKADVQNMPSPLGDSMDAFTVAYYSAFAAAVSAAVAGYAVIKPGKKQISS